ncbi:MAG: CBS domain-containing protein [Candidatus Saccharimonadaceae bacterium]
MTVFLVILAILFFVCLILATAMHPVRPAHSLKELKRRSKKSDAYVLELDRYELHAALVTLSFAIRAVLLVLIACSLVGAYGWLGGLVSVIIALIYPVVARIGGVKRSARKLYKKIEPKLLDFSDRFGRILQAFREPSINLHEPAQKLDSREDLADLIELSTDVIGQKERLLLVSALAFPGRTVAEVMTPRTAIDFIKKSEFLGPLVLDELHTLGHSRLPVIAEDLDHVVGLLHLRDLLSLDIKRSATAEKAMEAKIFYIHEDDTLEQALADFIKERHHLFIVINKKHETVGLVTLEDVVEVLIGRKLIEEQDVDGDLSRLDS